MWRMCSCCGGEEITQVDVYGNDTTVGLVGLKQAFEQLYAAGLGPNDSVGDELLARIKAANYVPRKAEELYKAALLREYAAYCQRRERQRR